MWSRRKEKTVKHCNKFFKCALALFAAWLLCACCTVQGEGARVAEMDRFRAEREQARAEALEDVREREAVELERLGLHLED